MNVTPILYDLAYIVSKNHDYIMKRYSQSDLKIYTKDDDSKVTEIDLEVSAFLEKHLPKITFNDDQLTCEIVISEENYKGQDISDLDMYWCIDPIDGTHNMINKNDDFMILVALIKNGVPILGCMYSPVFDYGFVGGFDQVFNFVRDSQGVILTDVTELKKEFFHNDITLLTFKDQDYGDKFKSTGILKYFQMINRNHKKLMHPGYSYEWDTAAPHAIIKVLGGNLYEGDTEMTYRKKDLKNKPFHISY